MGGPGICPACDCGVPANTTRVNAENYQLRAQIIELEAKLAAAEKLLCSIAVTHPHLTPGYRVVDGNSL